MAHTNRWSLKVSYTVHLSSTQTDKHGKAIDGKNCHSFPLTLYGSEVAPSTARP